MTATDLDSRISAYFAAEPAHIHWPYPFFEELQQVGSGVVDWPSGPAILATRHHQVKQVMLGEVPVTNDGYRYGTMADGVRRRLPAELHDLFYKVFDFETLFMSRHDGEVHQRLRKIAAPAFSARRTAELRTKVQAHVDELVDDLAVSDEPDWKAQVADQLPVRVIADLLGVPQRDRGKLWDFAEAIAAHYTVNEETLRAADQAIEDLKDYVQALIAEVRATGEGAPLTKVLIDAVDAGQMTGDELVAMYLLILFGGSETTTNLLGNGFLGLQRYRDQWDALVADPGLMPAAVEEMIRYDQPLQYLPRTATETFTFDGVEVPKGHTLIIMIAAANRDPDVFAEPDRLDIRRPNASQHLGFALGAHFCLGAALARMEAQLAFQSVTQRFPEARLTIPHDDVPRRGKTMLRAIAHLPLELGPDKGRG